jgi:MFS transporter, PAT family, beta-lactamase induction signal transducer AmpG
VPDQEVPAEGGKRTSPWAWIPTLYFAQGIPYVVVMLVSVIMFKRLGISNTDIALYTSWLYLPWVIKPLWSPLVDLVKTKRAWVVAMQLLVGAGLAGIAFSIPAPNFFQWTLAFMWLLAFSSATHDIAADGLYMLALTKHDQAWFVGVRSTFYRIAMITGQGLLIIFAGYIEATTGLDTVEVGVRATQTEQVAYVDPAQIQVEAQPGDLRIITYPSDLEIGLGRIPTAQADSVKAMARQWNVNNGFYQVEGTQAGPATSDDSPANGEATTNVEQRRGVWGGFVGGLESFLRRNFGPDEDPVRDDGLTGNVGIIYFYLSGAPEPGDEVVMNFGREAGNVSVSLSEGERYVFTSENWNVPAMAVIQLDHRLDFATEATFRGRAGNIPLAWSITFMLLTGMFILFFLYHRVILPRSPADRPAIREAGQSIFAEFFRTFALFFRKKGIAVILLFLLFYRFGEAQLVKLASPFLLDAQEAGGLALTTGEVGFVYGTVGILALTAGGIIGGILAARHGLRFWLWPMVIAINVPNAVYIYLAYALPDNFVLINLAVLVEQFGYGFGFTAYMLYMIYVSEGEHKTAHFAITTGFMALGMMIPGMFSGWIQEIIGYQHFFVWVLLSTIPAFIIAAFVKIDPEFGKKKEADPESVIPTEDQSVIEPPDGATPDARPDEPRDRD